MHSTQFFTMAAAWGRHNKIITRKRARCPIFPIYSLWCAITYIWWEMYHCLMITHLDSILEIYSATIHYCHFIFGTDMLFMGRHYLTNFVFFSRQQNYAFMTQILLPIHIVGFNNKRSHSGCIVDTH